MLKFLKVWFTSCCYIITVMDLGFVIFLWVFVVFTHKDLH